MSNSVKNQELDRGQPSVILLHGNITRLQAIWPAFELAFGPLLLGVLRLQYRIMRYANIAANRERHQVPGGVLVCMQETGYAQFA
jgi:hypothetical protein